MTSPQQPLPDDWETQDAVNGYLLWMELTAERTKSGEPLPECFRSTRGEAGE